MNSEGTATSNCWAITAGEAVWVKCPHTECNPRIGWQRAGTTPRLIPTGFRQSEILNLQWCNADLFWRTITLLEQKNGGSDTLPVNAKTLAVLKARAKVRSLKTDYVCYNGAGNRMDARDLLRAFYPAMKKAEVKRFRFHDLRHTFATRLVQAGADIYTVQKLGRWKTISMVMRYAHHHPESLRAGIEILDRVPAGVSTIG